MFLSKTIVNNSGLTQALFHSGRRGKGSRENCNVLQCEVTENTCWCLGKPLWDRLWTIWLIISKYKNIKE